MAPPKFTRDLIEALQHESIIAAFGAIFDAKLKMLTDRVNVVEAQNIALKEEIQEQKVQLKAASQKIVALEAYNRKENLITIGLPLESYSEATSSATPETVTALSVTHVRDTEQAVLKLCQDCLNIDITTRDISTAHRLKVKQGVNDV